VLHLLASAGTYCIYVRDNGPQSPSTTPSASATSSKTGGYQVPITQLVFGQLVSGLRNAACLVLSFPIAQYSNLLGEYQSDFYWVHVQDLGLVSLLFSNIGCLVSTTLYVGTTAPTGDGYYYYGECECDPSTVYTW
jgi:hypothetical protein